MLFKDLYNKIQNQLNNDQKRDFKWLALDYLDHTKQLFDLPLIDINKEQEQYLINSIARLKSNEPLAHILGYTYFYGNKFVVDKNVLVPRPETEQLCELIINDNKNVKNLNILDMCTGSGCIAITLAKNLDCSVTAVDISDNVLSIAKQNAKNLNADINFIKSDMFTNLDYNKYDIIVSNPPYIETNTIATLSQSVKDYEPHLALDGGNDGLDFYKIIAKNISNYLKQNGTLYLEIGFNQGKTISKILNSHFNDIVIKKDYNDLDRIIRARSLI